MMNVPAYQFVINFDVRSAEIKADELARHLPAGWTARQNPATEPFIEVESPVLYCRSAQREFTYIVDTLVLHGCNVRADNGIRVHNPEANIARSISEMFAACYRAAFMIDSTLRNPIPAEAYGLSNA